MPNDDFISPNSKMKSPAHVQMSFMKSKNDPAVPGKYAWVLEAIEQLTVCKYQGRPHWGKNTERTYLHPKCGIKAKYPLLPKLQSIQDKYDPLKVYEPRLFSQLVAGEAYSLQPQCVLSGACFCQKDEHCAPDFRCVPSNAFPEYLVCKYKLDVQSDDDR